ncbi:MAG: hypothetical protein K2M47_07265 [Clostridiales bacterium]|nr:hypothetical protein [Clostridiales bacterium]
MDGCQLALSVAVMVQDKLLLDAVTQEKDAQDSSVQKLQSAVSSAVAEIARDFPSLENTTGDSDSCASGWAAYEELSMPNCISAEMLAQLVARNYCILCGRLDEAEIFDSRYDEYAVALRLKRRVKLRPRKFL